MSINQRVLVKYVTFFTFVICLQDCSPSRLGDIHTSAAQILKLVEMESKVVQRLSDYIQKEEKRIGVIKRYIEEWNRTDPENYVINPLNSYHFLRRLSSQYENVNKALVSGKSSEVVQEITEERSGYVLPHEADVNGAAWALVRLQSIYNLTMNDMIEGYVSGAPAVKGLKVEDCLRFAKQSFSNLEFDLSEKWTLKAIELLEEEEKPMSPRTLSKIEKIKETLKKRKMMRSMVTDMARKSEKGVAERFSGMGIPSSFQKVIHTDPAENAEITELERGYLQLCRGETVKTDDYYRGLSCSYKVGSSFYRLLTPFKIELIWPDPIIVVFHDVLSDKESQLIMDLALPKLRNTQVHSFISHQAMASLSRIGKTAWVPHGDSGDIDKILRRVEYMTGLSSKSSEDFHILNYGIGGHYDVHVDFFDLLEKKLDPTEYHGDRITTVLFYLNDVDAGGATVFPTLNVSISPEKGSALVWFNLKRSGLGDYRTVHASCPVLLGQKWIANLWLHEFGQEFRWPCKLDPDL